MMITYENVKAVGEKYGALQHPAEACAMLSYLNQRRVQTIVEVGVWKGGLAALFSTFVPEAKLLCVDLLGTDHEVVGKDLERSLRDHQFTHIIADSQSPETVERAKGELRVEKFDFVFIDAAHDYESVKKDYENWFPHAIQVGFHDLYNEMGVLPLWEEIIKNPSGSPKLRALAIWKDYQGLGIGVV